MFFWFLPFPPKNERKQIDLRFHSSKVKFGRSFFGGNVYLKKSFLIWSLFLFQLKLFPGLYCMVGRQKFYFFSLTKYICQRKLQFALKFSLQSWLGYFGLKWSFLEDFSWVLNISALVIMTKYILKIKIMSGNDYLDINTIIFNYN